MADMESINKAIRASENFQELMQGILPTFILGINSFVESSNNPNISATKEQSLHVLNGVLIVHLFSMWDSYFENNAVDKYFRPEEKKRFYAFKHIRIVAAHNINGNRKGNKPNQERMHHSEKLDEIMNSDSPIPNVEIEHLKVNLGKSQAALDCRQFLQGMAMRLATGRIGVGGAFGQIRTQGGEMTDVL